MKSSTPEHIEILITRYFIGKSEPDEIIELSKWINASYDNLLYFQQLKNIWDNSGHFTGEKMININKAFNLIKKRITFTSPVANIWFYWKRIAAVLLIPLIIGNLLYFIFSKSNNSSDQEPVYNELYAAFGTRSALKLSDGSSVWLNSGSSIKYPDRFIGNSRTVFLVGEAYFEVESNLTKPFIVETSSLKVKATGTKFNVSVYPSDDKAEVTLVSGKVDISRTDAKGNVKNSKLDKNQLYSFNKADFTTSITNVDSYKYISWKDGKLVFRNEPLSDVVKEIGQIFNCDIEIKGEDIKNYSYRATFQDESLEEILKLLKISSPIDYTEVKRIPLPDGSFPRKKIIIFAAGHKKTL